MTDPTDIPIGIIHSLTGTMANNEKHLVNAIFLAIEEINNSGGILGRTIVPFIEDGASDPLVFEKKAQKLLFENNIKTLFNIFAHVKIIV